ncbi:ABC transporter ATP-binding protein [Stappia indica]|uniref:Amino acid/amide ABC transporter ATP-binding protein 2, HAAT family n=1 Tax=Stappia indica TaxID=538381 RepID=A0A285R5X4_9HYPH|nr:ABC transporter ATP-binding protein [Stappia indica]SOB89490.1 amino acid/amide ABC transporter ATP-binding protein 2, HAAT family [Stappia indica]
MTSPVLEGVGIRAGYGDVEVLRGIDIALPPKSVVALIGANGAGKTTLLKTISGLLPLRGGEIRINGEPIGGLAPHKVVEAGFVQSPEGKQLFPEMTITENLMVGAHSKRARARRDETMEEVFELFPILRERARQRAGTMSGGQQQMIAVGRALMALPKVLALDEPSLGLAPIMVSRLMESIEQIRHRDLSILIIEQNIFQVLKMADHAYVLENGEIAKQGGGQELLADPHLRSTYLGL